MSAAYGSLPFNARTYGRKSSAKRRHSNGTPVDDDESLLSARTRKRRKVSTEIAQPEPESKSRKVPRDPSTEPEQHDKVLKPAGVRTAYGFTRKSTAGYRSPSPSSHPKPTRIAQDLTRIFDAAAPKTLHPRSPTKLAKRMLARSKTDTSAASSSASGSRNGSFERTPSLPILHPSPPQKSTSVHADPPTPIPIPLPAPTTTRTYAGKSRSFLVAIPTSTLSSLSGLDDLEEDDYSTRESYTSLRTRWGVDNSEDDPYPAADSPSPSATPNASPPRHGKGKAKAPVIVAPPLPPGMMNPLKSITELRSKGESRRFLDEVGYLFEGMDRGGGIGLRRSSAVEITTKLCDTEFVRKAKAADFLGRIWDVLSDAGAGRGEDKVLDILLAFFAALVARDQSALADLAQRPSSASSSIAQQQHLLVDTLFSLIHNKGTDPLSLVSPDAKAVDVELKRAGIAKKDRALLTTIYDTIANKSSIFPSSTHISTPLLITQTLQALPPSLITPKHLPTLLSSLRASLSPLLARSASSSAPSFLTRRPSDDEGGEISFTSVYNHLRLLDMYLLGQWSSAPDGDDDLRLDDNAMVIVKEEEGGWGGPGEVEDSNRKEVEKAMGEWLVDGLVVLGVYAEMHGRRGPVQRCTEIALRVLVSLTHSEEKWCTKVIEHELTMGFVARVILDTGLVGIETGKGNRRIKAEEDIDEEREGEEESAGEAERIAATHALDRLCLALGLLTNLIQVLDAAKDLVRDTRLDPSCTYQKRSCLQTCTCPNPISVLDILTHLYVNHLPPILPKSESEDPTNDAADADASFLRGHLAILFGLLMQGNQANQDAIFAALPPAGADQKRGKLSRLVDQAREFVAFYAVLSGSTGDGGENADGEGKIAKAVVVFLEALQDES